MPNLAILMVFATCFIIFLSLIRLTLFRNPFRERLRKVSGKGEQEESKFKFLTETLKGLGKISSPEEEKLFFTQKTLFRAGYRGKNAPIVFYGLKTLLAILAPIILWILRFSVAKLTNVQTMLLCVAVAVVGFYLPNLWIRLKVAKRAEKIRNGFPDALDLLVVCVEAGQGLDAALDRVGREIKMANRALGEEFKLLNLEIRAGKPRKEALRHLALRTGVEEISSLVALLAQTEELGVSVAQSLRVHSDAMRTERLQRAEQIAARIPVKMTFPLILFIFPCLFVVMSGPALITLIRNVILK